ncbi:MAG: radical SAM protein [Elusimicrobia bacterium]|nr:radical SAM protein [Elusimicrobiota bacterium]
MNVLLVQPPLDDKPVPGFIYSGDASFPIGLAYVAAALERDRHHVEIMDCQVLRNPGEKLLERVRRGGLDVIGFSTTIASIRSACDLAQAARRLDRSVCLMVGGAYPSVYGGKDVLLRCAAFSLAVIGEGEQTVVEVLDCLARGGDLERVRSVAFRRGDEILETPRRPLIDDIDSIPSPARHLFDLAAYRDLAPGQFLRLPQLPILSSRGCPYHCEFCDDKAVWLGRVRLRAPERIVAEIEEMIRKYRVREIKFYDDTLTVSKERAVRLCRLLIEKRLDIIWRCSARVDEVDRELLGLMKRAGCRSISYGIESGDDEILKKMDKGTTTRQARDAVRWTNEAGIAANGMFILNYPGETVETVEKTISFAQSLDLSFAGFNLAIPLGSRLREKIIRGYRLNQEVWDNPSYSGTEVWFFQEGLTPEYLKAAYSRAARGFYLRPSYLIRALRSIRNMAVLKSYLRGFFRLMSMTRSGRCA